MQPPEELMVGIFLPSMRLLVAKLLQSEGFTQSRIAAMLGVTQASVSLYLSSPPARAFSSLASLSLSKEEAERYAALLAEDLRRNPVYAVETLGSVWRGVLGRGLACDAHRRLYPALAQCDVCMREYAGRRVDRSGVLAEVSEAVRLLEGSRAFVKVMPEVSVNLACTPEDAETVDDVVAVPGRIVKVKGAARAILPPEFGASKHLARILLLVQKRRKDARACLNLRYDAKMERALKKLGLKVISIGGYPPSISEDATVVALSNRLLTRPSDFDAVADTGGKGIEPNVYVFAKGAREVAGLALRVSRIYSAS